MRAPHQPHFNAGRPKSRRHRRALSIALKAWHVKVRAALAAAQTTTPGDAK